MFSLTSNTPASSLKPMNFVLWFVLAFQAGTINVGGFLSAQRFVTHVTGFATHFAVDLASSKYIDAASMLMVPFFFLLGCMTSALLIDRRKFLRQTPHYTASFIGTSLAFFTITLFGWLGLLGPFGTPSSSLVSFFLLSLLAFLSGLQNSMITLSSGLLVRTTHLTGITTDLGVGLIRMFYPYKTSDPRIVELKMNLLRIGTIMAFIFGSILGGIIFYRWQFFGFLLPTIISGVLAYVSWKLHDVRIPKPPRREI